MSESPQMTMEQMNDKVVLMEQFAIGVLDAFNKLGEGHKETQEAVATLSKKIQELAQNNDELQMVLERIAAEGVPSGEGGGGSVSPEQIRDVVNELVAQFVYEKLDFTKVFKGHTAKIFQEVEKRYLQKYPPPGSQKKKQLPKVIAASVAITLLGVAAVWGVIANVREKPYYELIIPKGEKVLWKEPGEAEPRQVALQGDMLVPLAHHKKGKYLFYTYDASGEPVKNRTGEPVAYYIYENVVEGGKVKAIKLGVAE